MRSEARGRSGACWVLALLSATLTSSPGGAQPTGTRTDRAGPLTRLDPIAPAVGACWSPPPGLAGMERIEITARFSLKRSGEIFGAPRVTFSTLDIDSRARVVLTRATEDAIRQCTPLPLSDGLGGSVAGRPIAIRFIYNGPKGQGV